MADMQVKQEPRGISLCIIAQRTVPTKWMFHMMKLQQSLPSGLFWQHIYSIDKYYDQARQEVVEAALKTNTEWILFVDTDVFLPADAVNRLMSHKEKIVTGVYWMKAMPPQPIIYEKLGGGPMWNIEPQDKLIPIAGAGLGCCLIHRSVFENMPKPWFKCNWSYEDQLGQEIKVAVGEDHYFFMKAKQNGFQPYCDSNVMCDHYDVVNDVVYPGEEETKRIAKIKLEKAGQLHLLDAEKKAIESYMNPKIAFYNVSNVKFNGNSIKDKSIAGSETAVIRMAQELSRRACNVSVYCNCDAEGKYENVQYLNFDRLATDTECDVFVSSRNTDIFLSPQLPKARKYVLWAHDMPDCPGWGNIHEAIGKIDMLVFVSEYHKNIVQQQFPCIPEDKCVVCRNGIHVPYFDGPVEKVPGKIVYSTTPFRGLDTLLEVFPKIKEQVPHATLEIFSGLDIYNLADGQYTDLYEKARHMDGVTYHGTVKQEQLARELKKCSLLAYPNKFVETSCITAMENIQAGNPVVTTKLGALPETVGDCGVLIDIDPCTDEYKQRFIDEVVVILNSEEKWKRLHENCRKQCDLDWSKRAETLYQILNIDQLRNIIQSPKPNTAPGNCVEVGQPRRKVEVKLGI